MESYQHDQETREKIRAAKLRYYAEHPGRHPGQQVTGTHWLSAQITLRNLRRHHPDLSEGEVERLAVPRILSRFPQLGSEAAARALLQPKQPGRRKPRRKPLRIGKVNTVRLAVAIDVLRREKWQPGPRYPYGITSLIDQALARKNLPPAGADNMRDWLNTNRALIIAVYRGELQFNT
jgi:hypothetical protein